MPIENIEKDVIKKSNKYVYLADGTHMSHSDFHQYKQDIRKEYALVHNQEFKDSIHKCLVKLSMLERIEQVLNTTDQNDWEKYYRESEKRYDELNMKMINHGRNLYSSLKDLPILNILEIDDGIKFIIQVNYKDKEDYRFCFDPYRLASNYHSSISEMYRNQNFHTVNGGWLKIIKDKVILYKSSGDYGVYKDAIALDAAKKIFPNKQIYTHAGKEWHEIKDQYEIEELPF